MPRILPDILHPLFHLMRTKPCDVDIVCFLQKTKLRHRGVKLLARGQELASSWFSIQTSVFDSMSLPFLSQHPTSHVFPELHLCLAQTELKTLSFLHFLAWYTHVCTSLCPPLCSGYQGPSSSWGWWSCAVCSTLHVVLAVPPIYLWGGKNNFGLEAVRRPQIKSYLCSQWGGWLEVSFFKWQMRRICKLLSILKGHAPKKTASLQFWKLTGVGSGSQTSEDPVLRSNQDSFTVSWC